MNRNALAVRYWVERQGGTVIAIREGGRHCHLRIRTALGAEFWLAVERGTHNDPRKKKAWVRQAINKADKGARE